MADKSDQLIPALEGQLRNMILGNAASRETSDGPSKRGFNPNHALQQDPPSSNMAGNLLNDFGTGPADETQQTSLSKAPRKRPNQAQRRQMSAQFSIDIDPRAQAPPLASNGPTSTFAHEQRGSSHIGRGQPSHYSRGPGEQRHNRTHEHRSQGSWQSTPTRNARFSQDSRQRSTVQHSNRSMPIQPGPYNNMHRSQAQFEDFSRAIELLEKLALDVINNAEIQREEIAEKEEFRLKMEGLSRQVITQFEIEQCGHVDFPPLSVELKCFGSLSSGFATKTSDMDLGLVSPLSSVQPDAKGSPVPRLLEKALLIAGVGARLLTRTRVPIIKLCQYPPEDLYNDLVMARQKWELQESEDPDATQEAGEDDRNDPDGNLEQHHAEIEGYAAANNTFEVPIGDSGETQIFHLEQESKTVAAYYSLAKRVLRIAGGRDVTISNANELSQQEWRVLDIFCEAFIRGLSDPFLRRRLMQYPSLSLGAQNPRSLLSIFVQTEGEQIVQRWENSAIKQAVALDMNEPVGPIKYWNNLLWKDASVSDLTTRAKELQVQLDKVKRIGSVQLSMLEQSVHELPMQYYSRTKGIIVSLQRIRMQLSRNLEVAIIDLYISGIHQDTVREAVLESWQRNSDMWDLQSVARRHASLHLAFELEVVLEKKLYPETVTETVQGYIHILRQPLQRSVDGRFFIVAIPQEQSTILKTIGQINDPHHLAGNQPKERYKDSLEFPKSGAGVQCDINFSAELALHNTQLLRCYSLTDPRVRSIVLFVKAWAKTRGINSGYRGTLSSYGYVLMVLHYLVNIVQPFVCPNLQELAPAPPPEMTAVEAERSTTCRGYNVHFWRNEAEIGHYAQARALNRNGEPIGSLLIGFFEYYAQTGPLANGSGRGFDWGRDVLSIRSHGGIISKQSKGWTGAKTVIESTAVPLENPPPHLQPSHNDPASQESGPSHTRSEVKEVRLRYLFAIEDPFETDHNVARTVTHNGIVSIRDEFRRAWKIIRATAQGNVQEHLLDDVSGQDGGVLSFENLLHDIHYGQT